MVDKQNTKIAVRQLYQYNSLRVEQKSEIICCLMLVRTYRLTDKIGIAILKSSTALGGLTVEGAAIILIWARRSGGSLFGIVFSLFFALFMGLYSLLKRAAQLLWVVLHVVLGFIGSIALFVLNTVVRLSGGTLTRARKNAVSSAVGVRVRRAARAEMEEGLREDPLRVQNRVLSGLVVVALAALVGVVLWATNPSRTPVIPSVFTANIDFSNPNTPVFTPGVVEFATAVPTATAIPDVLQALGSIAYVVREAGQQDIWVVPVGSRTGLRLTNSPADDRDPAWSPDGRRLAYASRRDGNWDLYIYDLDTQTTTRMTFGLEFQGSPHWSPDGKWLVYESYQAGSLDIYVMPTDGSRPPEPLPGNSTSADFSPAWSPDLRRIAFVSWRDGNQDIYIFSLDDGLTYNLTNTPTRNEDYPSWSPDGRVIAFSALDEGLEKVFTKVVDRPDMPAQVIGLGRMPTWSPDGTSILFAVDSVESTQLVAAPVVEGSVAVSVIPVPLGANSPSWTGEPLPAALVNSGGLPAGVTAPLYIEQENPTLGDPPYRLDVLVGVRADPPYLSERVNDSFNALRQAVLQRSGIDFLGVLRDTWWDIDRLPQAGESPRSWYKTGRAFGFNRDAINGFPPPIEVVREDLGVNTYWRVFVRVAEDAQAGQLGEPLRQMPWDFLSRASGNPEAYEQGGRLRSQMPSGYYIDLTQLALDYGWLRVPAESDWRANINSVNYWVFRKTDGLDWYQAMREIYAESQMGGFAPTATPRPTEPAAP